MLNMKQFSLIYIVFFMLVFISAERTSPDSSDAKALHFYYHANYDSARYYSNLYFESAKDSAELLARQIQLMRFYSRSLSRSGYPDSAHMFLDSISSALKKNAQSDDLRFASLFDEKGMLSLNHASTESAKKYFEMAFALKRRYRSDPDTLLADSYSYLGEVAFHQGDFADAELLFDKALQSRQSILQQSHYTFPLVFTQIGLNSYYSYQYKKSAKYHQLAIDRFKALYGNDHPGVMINYNNLSNALYYIGEWDSAVIALDSAIQCAIRNGRTVNLSNYLLNLSQFFQIEGNWEKSLALCKEVQIYMENNSNTLPRDLSNLYDMIGGLYQSMGYYEPSNQYFVKAKDIKKQTFGEISIPYAQYLHNIGVNLMYQNQYEEAEKQFYLGLNILKRCKAVHQVLYAHTLSNLANCKKKRGYLQTSEDLYKQSSALYLKLYGHYNQDAIAEELTLLKFRVKKVKAASYYQTLRKLLQQMSDHWAPHSDFDVPELNLVGRQYAMISLMHEMGSCLLSWYRESESLDKLQAGIDHVDLGLAYYDRQYGLVGNFRARGDLTEQSYALCELGADICYEAFIKSGQKLWLSKLCEYAERARSFYLREAIRNERAADKVGVPDALIQQERDLSSQLQSFYSLALEGLTNDDAEKKFQQNKRKYDKLLMLFKKEYPKYYELRYQLHYPTLETVQKELDKDSRIVMIVKGQNFYYRLTIDRSEADLKPVLHVSEAASCIQELYNAMHTNQTKDFARTSYLLFESLSLIDNGNLKNKLIWIPDGVFVSLNPEILTTRYLGVGDGMAFNGFDYLILKSTVYFAESLEFVLKPERKTSLKKKYALAAFAPFSIKEASFACSVDNQKFTRLPWAERLVGKLKESYNGIFLSGRKASKSAVVDAMKKSEVLYFATHAISNTALPLKSCLVLSCAVEKDGNLTLLDLFGTQLDNQLAILAACNSGNGEFVAGEGPMSIARGFRFAGVNALAMALWSIDDMSSAGVTEAWFDAMSHGIPSGDALRLAKLQYLLQAETQLKNPLYWSGMVFLGQNVAVNLDRRSGLLTIPRNLILVGICLLFIVIFTYLIRYFVRNIKNKEHLT
jgi:CHAT domain-containing protein